MRASQFYALQSEALAPFVPEDTLARLVAGAGAPSASVPPRTIGAQEPYLQATLRGYQVEGVNWLLRQYALGMGGLLGDESIRAGPRSVYCPMRLVPLAHKSTVRALAWTVGLGKTLQTLAFLGALKAAGLPGPHLVVTPLAVLQNWANELKRFTPSLSFVKIHGGVTERDRILGDPAVLRAEFDIYLVRRAESVARANRPRLLPLPSAIAPPPARRTRARNRT